MSDLSKRRQRQLKNEGYDLAFLSQIQPQGNIDFQKDDRSWISGDGHHTVLHYYEYPTECLFFSVLATLSKFSSLKPSLPAQRPSSARFSSLFSPIRGKPVT